MDTSNPFPSNDPSLQKVEEKVLAFPEPTSDNHVDMWLDDVMKGINASTGERYARAFLELCRMPAWKRSVYSVLTDRISIQAEYKNKKYDVVGASRMGDIWIKDPRSVTRSFYDLRVLPNELSHWTFQVN